MVDQIADASTQKYLYASFNTQIAADSTIVVKDQDGNVITTFTTDRTIKTLLYSSADLNYSSYKIYVNDEEVSFSNVGEGSNSSPSSQQNNISNVLLIALLTEIGTLAIVIAIAVVLYKKSH